MSFVGRGQQSLLGFDPGSVGGLILWLDAADRNTITMTGSNVSSWFDKSKNGYTMNTAPSGCSLPITGSNLNGLSTVGINTYSTGIKQSTVIPTFTNAFWVRKERTGNEGFQFYFGSDGNYDFHPGDNAQFVHSGLVPQGVRDASLSMFRSTGVTTGTLATTVMPTGGQINLVSISNMRGPARVQGLSYDRGNTSRSATCDWGEVLLYSNALTPAQIQAVEGYLAWKWGISSYLPTTHTHRTSPPAVRPFSPLDMRGLTLWLDGADCNSMNLTGSNITLWRDKSGFNRNVSNSGTGAVFSSNGPVFGGGAAFLGSADYLHSATTGEWSMFTVITPTNVGANNPRILNYIGQWFYIEGRRFTMFNPQIFGSEPGENIRYLTNIVNDVCGFTLYVNGRADVSTTPRLNTSSGGGFTVGGFDGGGGDRFYGTIHELMTFSNGLTTAERQRVESYLAQKWGISGIMTNHPYRYTAPSFVPTQLPGCVLWLDATDSSYVQRSGGTLTGWVDKSPNARTTTLTGTLGWSNNTVTTSSSRNSYLSANLNVQKSVAPNLSVFLVYTWLGFGSNVDQVLWGNDVPNSLSRVQMLTFPIANGSTFRYAGGTTLWELNTPNTMLYAATVSLNSNSLISLNGVPRPTFTEPAANLTSNAGWNTIYFGTGHLNAGYFNAHVAFNEILVYTSNLSTTDRQLVEGYLGWKWGLRSNLGVTHPAPFYRSLALPFTPLQLPGLAFWLDAADATTFTLSGSNVTQWRDKSSNGFAGSGVANPVRTTVDGYSAVTFDGTSQYIDFGDVLDLETAPLNIFAVSRFNPGASGAIIAKARLGVSQNRWALFREGSTLYTFAIGDSGQGVLSYNDTNNSRRLLSWTWDRSTQTLFQNGISIASGAYANTSAINSTNSLLVGFYNNTSGTGGGNGYYFGGSINEIICVFGAMTAGQRRQVEGHLAWKWGLLGDLGGGETHPYRYGPLTRTPFQSTPTGVAFWLDAADATTFTLSGSNVTQWRDKAVGYVGTAVSNPVRTTVDGLPAVTFNGSTQYIDFGNVADLGSAPLNIFVVSRYNTTAAGTLIAKTLGPFGPFRFALFRAGGVLCTLLSSTGSNHDPQLADTNTSRRILAWSWDRTTNTLHQNSQLILSSSFSNTEFFDSSFNLLVGAYPGSAGGGPPPQSGTFFNGSVNEILGIFGTLTTTQRQQVEGYLAEKWNLRSALLPARHPYITGAPSGFTPASISSCLAWLDAADASSFTLSGSNVTRWNDKSGRGNHFTTLAGTSPTYSSNEVVFPSGAVMRSSASIEVSFSTYAVIVFRLMQPNDFSYVLSFTNISPGGFTGHYSIRANGGILGGTAASLGNEADFGNANYFVNGTFNPSFGGSTYSNAPVIVAAKNMSMTGTTTVELSAAIGRYFVGRMYEVMLFSSPLTTAQRQQVEGYLAVKWGISSSLPVGHPSLPPSFLPTSVPGCSLWLDASDASTLTLSGSNVTAWRDKTGLTTLSLTGTSPTYVSNQVRFNSSGRFQGAYTMTTQTTMFLVYSTSNTTTNSRLVTMGGNEYGNIHAPVGPNNDIFLYDGGSTGLYASVTPQTGLRMYTAGFNGLNTALWRNGSPTTLTGNRAAGPPTGTALTIGAYSTGGEPWNGELSELIFFNTALTTSNRQQVEGYLAWKWGLTTSLPVGHPSRPYFLPTDVSGCSLWLDAADATTLTLTGSNVTQWRDKSSNGFHATGTGSTTRQAFNSLQGINIGPGNYFSFSNATAINTTSALTTFVVATATTPGNFGRLLVFVGASGGGDAQSTSNVVAFQRGDGNQIGYERASLSRGSITYTAPFQFVGSAVFSPSTGIQFINGSSNASGGQTGAFNYFQYWIGRRADGGFEWAGSVCEVLAYNFEMTLDQRQQVEGYLAAKWGLSSTFPVGHPYLSGPQISITPMSIPGCSLWLDAADSSTLLLSGSNITQWRDKSGRGYHAVAVGTPTIQSLCNSTYQGVLCSGTSAFGYNNGTAMNPGQFLTTFAVAYLSGGGEYNRILGFATDATDDAVGRGGCVPFSRRGGEYKIMFERGTGVTAAAIPITQGVLFQGSSVYGPTSGIQYINGQSNASISHVDASFNYTRYGVGQNGRATGDRWPGVICEVITYDALLTTAQRQQVEGYLAWKWGLQTELPTFTHPYKLTRP